MRRWLRECVYQSRAISSLDTYWWCTTPGQLSSQKPISNQYFDIFNNATDVWSLCSHKEEYRLAPWWIKHNLSRAAINELFRNPTMVTISNVTLSYTLLRMLNEMSYAMGTNFWISRQLCYNPFANQNNLCDNNYTPFFPRNAVEYIEFHIQQPVFR
jgi:hypothetical protein